MKKYEIMEAIAAATEFLERARVCTELKDIDLRIGCAKSGALRRQSMELTRALARMRQYERKY